MAVPDRLDNRITRRNSIRFERLNRTSQRLEGVVECGAGLVQATNELIGYPCLVARPYVLA
jgi:hypothetical protein